MICEKCGIYIKDKTKKRCPFCEARDDPYSDTVLLDYIGGYYDGESWKTL